MAGTCFTSGTPGGFMHDQEFWLEDGNIILWANQVVFRVYRGILSIYSPVFRDMFSGCSPNTEEMLDGCPIVHLSDSPQDLRHFLRAILHISRPMFYRTFDDIPPIPINELLAVARLAHKYEADDLLRQALTCLQTYYTNRFNAWDRDGQFDVVPFETPDTPSYAIGVLNLARLTDTPSMLPLAFYDCSLLDGNIVHGWKHEDGTVEWLSIQDLVRCVDGGRALTNRAACSAFTFPSGAIMEGCPSRSPVCADAIWAVGMELRDRPASHALHTYTCFAPLLTHLSRLCDACNARFEKWDVEGRKSIWAKLPAFFKLEVDGWETNGLKLGT